MATPPTQTMHTRTYPARVHELIHNHDSRHAGCTHAALIMSDQPTTTGRQNNRMVLLLQHKVAQAFEFTNTRNNPRHHKVAQAFEFTNTRNHPRQHVSVINTNARNTPTRVALLVMHRHNTHTCKMGVKQLYTFTAFALQPHNIHLLVLVDTCLCWNARY